MQDERLSTGQTDRTKHLFNSFGPIEYVKMQAGNTGLQQHLDLPDGKSYPNPPLRFLIVAS